MNEQVSLRITLEISKIRIYNRIAYLRWPWILPLHWRNINMPDRTGNLIAVNKQVLAMSSVAPSCENYLEPVDIFALFGIHFLKYTEWYFKR